MLKFKKMYRDLIYLVHSNRVNRLRFEELETSDEIKALYFISLPKKLRCI